MLYNFQFNWFLWYFHRLFRISNAMELENSMTLQPLCMPNMFERGGWIFVVAACSKFLCVCGRIVEYKEYSNVIVRQKIFFFFVFSAFTADICEKWIFNILPNGKLTIIEACKPRTHTPTHKYAHHIALERFGRDRTHNRPQWQ